MCQIAADLIICSINCTFTLLDTVNASRLEKQKELKSMFHTVLVQKFSMLNKFFVRLPVCC